MKENRCQILMVASYSFHLKLIWKAQEKSSFHFRMVVMSFIRKQEIRWHLGMLCLENSLHFHAKSHLQRHRGSCRPVPQLRRGFPRILMRLLPAVRGVMADLWPCPTASTLVILLGNKSNEALITLQTTGCNYTFKSRSLEGGWWLWLERDEEKSKSHKTNRFLILNSKKAWL